LSVCCCKFQPLWLWSW